MKFGIYLVFLTSVSNSCFAAALVQIQGQIRTVTPRTVIIEGTASEYMIERSRLGQQQNALLDRPGKSVTLLAPMDAFQRVRSIGSSASRPHESNQRNH